MAIFGVKTVFYVVSHPLKSEKVKRAVIKALIVFYSRTGNTRFVAEAIARNLKGDLEELVDKKKRGGIIGWLRAGNDASRKKETGLEQTKFSPAKFDLIVLGDPVWNKRVTPAMRTYLNRDDISKKKIALFNTSGSGKANTPPHMKELAKNQDPVAQLVLGKVLKNKEESEKSVAAWCVEIKSKLK